MACVGRPNLTKKRAGAPESFLPLPGGPAYNINASTLNVRKKLQKKEQKMVETLPKQNGGKKGKKHGGQKKFGQKNATKIFRWVNYQTKWHLFMWLKPEIIKKAAGPWIRIKANHSLYRRASLIWKQTTKYMLIKLAGNNFSLERLEITDSIPHIAPVRRINVKIVPNITNAYTWSANEY